MTASNFTDAHHFRRTIGNDSTDLFILKSREGLIAEITNYGATLVGLWHRNEDGKYENLVVGFDHLRDYIHHNPSYFGATIGRYANRIKNACFTLEGRKFQLSENHGNHQLHGGIEGFDKKVWKVISHDPDILKLSYDSAAGEEGFPGNLRVVLTYKMLLGNSLSVTYEAITDHPTPVNLTHHSYFNLNGAGNGTILNHTLQIMSDHYTPADKDLIPVGRIDPLTRPLDFRQSKLIGKDLQALKEFHKTGGYDHNYVVGQDDGMLRHVATAAGDLTGRSMKVYTTEPGLQLYTGQWIKEKTPGKSDKTYGPFSGFCLETQHFPDSPNRDIFPSTILYPGDKYQSTTHYQFGMV